MMLLLQAQMDPISMIFSWGIFILILLAMGLGYKITMYILRRVIKRFDPSLGFINGLRFVIRFIFIIIAFGIFITLSGALIPGGLPIGVTLIISTVIGTVFALSTTTVIQNFIAGIYIILTRPFGIGDLIRIGSKEGIVDEISLNHKKLRRKSGTHDYISNQAILSSKIVNFAYKIDPFGDADGDGKITIKDAFKQREVIRYEFELKLPKEKPREIKKKLQEIADKYSEELYRPPEFITVGLTYKAIVKVVITTESAEKVFDIRDRMKIDIFKALF